MEPSREKLSAAVVLLLVLVMAAETGPVQAGECLTRSTKFKGWCFNSGRCAAACMQEGAGYTSGKCRGLYLRCFCITPCGRADGDQSGGAGGGS